MAVSGVHVRAGARAREFRSERRRAGEGQRLAAWPDAPAAARLACSSRRGARAWHLGRRIQRVAQDGMADAPAGARAAGASGRSRAPARAAWCPRARRAPARASASRWACRARGPRSAAAGSASRRRWAGRSAPSRPARGVQRGPRPRPRSACPPRAGRRRGSGARCMAGAARHQAQARGRHVEAVHDQRVGPQRAARAPTGNPACPRRARARTAGRPACPAPAGARRQ